MEQPVVVGVDGTPDSMRALDWAVGEAGRLGAPLVLVHGYVPLAGAARLLAGDAERQHRAAQNLLDEAVARVRSRRADIPVTTSAVVRPAAELLVEHGRDALMIVLGSRRPGPVSGFLLGSVGLRVLSRAACPVVMTRGGTTGRRPREGGIVVGVPQDEGADAVLDFAFRTAAARGVPVRAVRAWNLPTVFTYRPGLLRRSDEHGGLEALHRHELAAAVKPWRRRHPDVPVFEHVELGPASELLVALAASAELLVVGRTTRAVRHVGHVAHAALHFADAPIALVPA